MEYGAKDELTCMVKSNFISKFISISTAVDQN